MYRLSVPVPVIARVSGVPDEAAMAAVLSVLL